MPIPLDTPETDYRVCGAAQTLYWRVYGDASAQSGRKGVGEDYGYGTSFTAGVFGLPFGKTVYLSWEAEESVPRYRPILQCGYDELYGEWITLAATPVDPPEEEVFAFDIKVEIEAYPMAYINPVSGSGGGYSMNTALPIDPQYVYTNWYLTSGKVTLAFPGRGAVDDTLEISFTRDEYLPLNDWSNLYFNILGNIQSNPHRHEGSPPLYLRMCNNPRDIDWTYTSHCTPSTVQFNYDGGATLMGAGHYHYEWDLPGGAESFTGNIYYDAATLVDQCSATLGLAGKAICRYMWTSTALDWSVYGSEGTRDGDYDPVTLARSPIPTTWHDVGTSIFAGNGGWIWWRTEPIDDRPPDCQVGGFGLWNPPASFAAFDWGGDPTGGSLLAPTVSGGAWVESAYGEPAYPPWGDVGDDPTADPPNYGSCRFDHLMYLTTPLLAVDDVLTFTVPEAGANYEATPQIEFSEITGWSETRTDSNVTVSTDGTGLKLVASAGGYTSIGALGTPLTAGIWLNGRFAHVRWMTSRAGGGSLDLQLGAHHWTLTTDQQNTLVTSTIDLLRPDSSEAGYEAADVQSIVPYEVTGSGDDIPAGWGISRLTKVKITCNEAGTFWLDDFHLFRHASGHCTLYVDPHQPWVEGGKPLQGGLYRKAQLVIDGAVVAEVMATWNDGQYTRLIGRTDAADPTREVYESLAEAYYYKNKGWVWPLKDYTKIASDPQNAELASPGISYTINFSGTDYDNEFLAKHLQITGLTPGAYEESAGVITVGLSVPVASVVYGWGIDPNFFAGGAIGSAVGYWRGWACGIAWNDDGPVANTEIAIRTPNASSGHETGYEATTDATGFWTAGPMNTKSDVECGSEEDGHLVYDVTTGKLNHNVAGGQLVYKVAHLTHWLRNRYCARVIITPELIGS